MHLLDPVIGAAANEPAIDLHFHNRQISTGGKCGAFRIDVTYSYSDIALCKLGADALDECVIIDQIDTIDSDQEAVLPCFLRKPLQHPVNELHVLERKQRQGDRAHRMIGVGKLPRIGERAGNHEARQRMKVGIVGGGNEIGGRDDPHVG